VRRRGHAAGATRTLSTVRYDTAALGFRRDATRYAGLADLYRAFRMLFLRCCYHQILGPCRQLPKFANGRCRYSDAGVCLDPHLTRQASKSYVERGNAFGLVSHKGSLAVRSGFLDRLLDGIAKRAKTPAMNSLPLCDATWPVGLPWLNLP
jgi:hypothetical protein